MITLQFVTLHALLLIFAFYLGKRASFSTSDRSYWKVMSIFIFLFTLEEGFRWARDIDWIGYIWTYESLWMGNKFNLEPFFYHFWRVCYLLNIPYPYVISISSLILIFSICLLAKEYKYSAYIFIPLAVIWISPSASNLFRWYTAFSMDIIGMVFLFKKKYIAFVLMIIMAFMTHIAAAVLILPCVCLYLLVNKMILRPTIVCIISICLILLANISILSNLMGIFNLFSGIARFRGYLENANDWFFSTGVKEGIERKSTLLYLFTMMPFYLVLLYGIKVRERIKRYDFYYNVLTLGVLLRSISSGSELVMRIATFYDFAFLVICAVYLSSFRMIKINWVSILLIFAIAYKTYVYIKPYKYDVLMHYYWNDNNINPGKAILYYMKPNYR